jgi:hypothetical protein
MEMGYEGGKEASHPSVFTAKGRGAYLDSTSSSA